MAGRVLADGRPLRKAGTKLPEDAELELLADLPYVSRGGLKLEAALDAFGIDPSGRTALDIGASTGGFTDCLLQRGAVEVLAVDVGYGQLDWKLRNDPRVRVLEKTNIRHADPAALGRFDLVVIDVSFISLRLVLPVAAACLAPGGRIVALVKPQFEVGRGEVEKGGIVRDPAKQRAAVEAIRDFARKELGLRAEGVIPSPVRGARGNQEYLAAFRFPERPGPGETGGRAPGP